ncbi:hypothetical protein ACFYV5_31395 [Streptomyces sp. NPDC003035]|uniref:hypothetical protein n=1 Tax=Streptomyces sp. NPDC003035 TaxID=3364676 RepID=UPI00368CD876
MTIPGATTPSVRSHSLAIRGGQLDGPGTGPGGEALIDGVGVAERLGGGPAGRVTGWDSVAATR